LIIRHSLDTRKLPTIRTTTMSDLAGVRRDYARKIMAMAGVDFPELEDAFATVPRETYVGPDPWTLIGAGGYEQTRDPGRLYDNVLVALVPEKGINNGEPAGHALWIDAAHPAPGEHAVHVGAGTGYYTAILAELVGPSGRVTAIEYDADLAGKAAANLLRYPSVTVIHGDGAAPIFDPADVIYVNAGVTHPAEAWLDGLNEGGRLVLPLTAIPIPGGFPDGAVFRFEKRGEDFLARWVSPTAFIPCEGMRDKIAGLALAMAFAKGGAQRVTRLVRHGNLPAKECWLRQPGWSLCY
jgi:protein-L-isoaspartate(D-aspartate) O-methyltransferase